jgi:hypothetical protein
MRNTHLWLRRSFLALVVGLGMSPLAVLLPQKALAAGETWTWTNNSTLSVSGGGLANNVTVSNVTSGATTQFTLKNTCRVQVFITIAANNKQAALTAKALTGLDANGAPTRVCTAAEVAGYTGNVNIGGTRGATGGTETNAQKEVELNLYSSKAPKDSPASVTFTVTGGSGGGAKTGNKVNFEESNGTASVYSVIYHLEPGNYKVCFSELLGCQNFVKKAGFNLNLKFGQSTSDQTVTPSLEIHITTADANVNFGPYDISITGDNGVNQTVQSETLAWKSPDSGQGGLVEHTINLGAADFTNVPPGKYKVCITRINMCQDIVKTGTHMDVKFVIKGTDAQNLVNGTDEQSPTCNANGDPLTWILCPIFNGAAGFADWILANILQPLLINTPIGLNAKDTTFKIWSSVRIYGNILLVLFVLITLIFSTWGGGVFEAYRMRKTIPKALAAAALINLSIYIVAGAVDIGNVVASSVANIITAPVRESAQFTFTPNGLQAAGVVGTAATGLISGYLVGLFFGTVVLQAALYIGLFVLLPAIVSLIGAFITIILLHALIILLVVTSPIAFALWCFPNTEQYFHTWWNWFFRALSVPTIIFTIFALADVMTVLVQEANGVGGGKPLLTSVPTNLVAGVVAFFIQFLPLALIGFALRLSGALVAKTHDFLDSKGKKAVEGIKGNPNDPNSLRNKTRRKLFETATQGQNRAVQAGNELGASRATALRGRMAQKFGRNVEERMSTYNKAARQRQDDLSNYGDDRPVYAGGGYAINKDEEYYDRESNSMKRNDSGGTMYFDSKARQISSNTFKNGKSKYGTSMQSYGQSFGYAMKKAQNDTDINAFRFAYQKNAEANGWNQADSDGIWAAATYEHKGPYASEWYSAPTVAPGADGKSQARFGASVSNVGNASSQKTYRKMTEDIHRNRQAYMLSGDRDRDFRIMHDWQTELENRVQSGTHTEDDVNDLIRTYEIFDNASSSYGQDTSGQQPGQQPAGQQAPVPGMQQTVTASGATSGAKPVIEAAVRNRHYSMTDISNGTRGLVERSTVPGQAYRVPSGVPGTSYGPEKARGSGGDAAPQNSFEVR